MNASFIKRFHIREVLTNTLLIDTYLGNRFHYNILTCYTTIITFWIKGTIITISNTIIYYKFLRLRSKSYNMWYKSNSIFKLMMYMTQYIYELLGVFITCYVIKLNIHKILFLRSFFHLKENIKRSFVILCCIKHKDIFNIVFIYYKDRYLIFIFSCIRYLIASMHINKNKISTM